MGGKMKFILRTNIYHYKTEGVLDLLRLAREELSLPELPAELVDSAVGSARQQRIELSEKTAADSGHFEKKSMFPLMIRQYDFDEISEDFWHIHVCADAEKDGRIKRVSFEWRLDSNKFVSVWKKAGYPTNLDFAM
jgi:hypothetical protein